MKAMLSWRLDEPMEHMADPPQSPAAIFRTSPGYDGEPAEPAVPPGFAPVASAGAWTLAAACSGGRPLRPSAARTGR